MLTGAIFICLALSVYDGDGPIKCQLDDSSTVKIRLWGVDAPEMACRRKRYSSLTAYYACFDKTAAKASRDNLRTLSVGKRLHCTKKHNSHDRVVAKCVVGNQDLACEQVKAGHAVDWPKYSKGYYSQC